MAFSEALSEKSWGKVPTTCVGAAAFDKLDWDCSSSWIAYTPLIFWLIDVVQPKSIAIVGDRARPAFLASCQFVSRFSLGTQIFGAFSMPFPDEKGTPGDQMSWRRVGAQHKLSAKQAQIVLAAKPVDVLVLDCQSGEFGGKAAPDLWQATVSGSKVIVLEAQAAEGPIWAARMANFPHFRVGSSQGAVMAILTENSCPHLDELLRDRAAVDAVRLCLERLGEGALAFQLAREQQTTSDRLEIMLSNATARVDELSFELSSGRSQIASLENEVKHLAHRLSVTSASKSELDEVLRQTLADREVLASYINAVTASTSWRLTSPIRAVLQRYRTRREHMEHRS
jgi:hypothetical protein